MNITWETYEHGRQGELKRYNQERNDFNLPARRRSAANKAHAKIAGQLKDKPLMALRHRLLAAGHAKDDYEIAKITAQMRAYLKEDRETGHYNV